MVGLVLLLTIFYHGGLGLAFHVVPIVHTKTKTVNPTIKEAFVPPTTSLWSSFSSDQQSLVEARSFLENYPAFYNLIDKNDELWKKLSDGDGYTMFVPTEEAFQELGDKKLKQMEDVRNTETKNKIGAFHCVAETVTYEQLYNSGGVVTLGGEAVNVDRTKTGGMFGVGGQDDGGLLINGAKVLQTYEVGPGMIYEVDKLVNPNILWRYMDQLRIPGSR